jgi:hypothetical protein
MVQHGDVGKGRVREGKKKEYTTKNGCANVKKK